MSDRVGQQLGNYRLTQYLGRGSFAEVYLGDHIHLNTHAAIKLLHTQLPREGLEPFREEARTIARLRHPGIVRVLEFGIEGHVPYLAMDYAPNGTLRQRHVKGISLSPRTVVPYVKQVAAALQYAHDQKVVHRDVKPENMLLGDNGEVLLGDFGVATIVESTLTNLEHVAGTVNYMAPEQISGKPQPASDQYALGIVIYEWLCGIVPFKGTYIEVAMQHERATPVSLRVHVPTISADVDKVVLTALAKKPEQRFRNIQAFATAFAQAAGAESAVPPLQVMYTNDRLTELIAPPPPPREYITPQPAILPSSYGSQNPYATHPTPPGSGPSMTPHFPVGGELGYAQMGGSPPPLQSPPFHQQMPPPLRPRPRKGLVVLLIILVLLFLAGSGLLYTLAVYQPQQHTANATATTEAQITGTARATAEALATVQAQEQATVTAHQNIYNLATRGGPTITDPLTNPDNYGWRDVTFTDNSGYCRFMGGAYHDAVKAGLFLPCYAAGTAFSDLAIQVSMVIPTGHTGGVTFRAPNLTSSADPYYATYVFRISTDGTYILDKIDTKLYFTALVTGASSAINQGNNQMNVLTVIARGDTFYLYVNKQYVASASDSTYTAGAIGLFAEGDTNPVEAVFSNLQVWRLH